MRNRYGGLCYRCGEWVIPGSGHFEKRRGEWVVQHGGCAREYRGQGNEGDGRRPRVENEDEAKGRR